MFEMLIVLAGIAILLIIVAGSERLPQEVKLIAYVVLVVGLVIWLLRAAGVLGLGGPIRW